MRKILLLGIICLCYFPNMLAQQKESTAYPHNGYLIFSPSYSHSHRSSFFTEKTTPGFEYKPFFMYGLQLGFGRHLSKHIDYRHINLLQVSGIYEFYKLDGSMTRTGRYTHTFSDDVVFKIIMNRFRINIFCGMVYGFHAQKITEFTAFPNLINHRKDMDVFWGIKGGLGLDVLISKKWAVHTEFSYYNLTKSDRYKHIYRENNGEKKTMLEKNYALRELTSPFSFINLTIGLNFSF